jgi:hypothetical protein
MPVSLAGGPSKLIPALSIPDRFSTGTLPLFIGAAKEFLTSAQIYCIKHGNTG